MLIIKSIIYNQNLKPLKNTKFAETAFTLEQYENNNELSKECSATKTQPFCTKNAPGEY